MGSAVIAKTHQNHPLNTRPGGWISHNPESTHQAECSVGDFGVSWQLLRTDKMNFNRTVTDTLIRRKTICRISHPRSWITVRLKFILSVRSNCQDTPKSPTEHSAWWADQSQS